MNKLMKRLVISKNRKNIKQLYCIYYFLFRSTFYRTPMKKYWDNFVSCPNICNMM